MTKTILITGANSGIGKAAALKLATMGHHVIMVCRNESRAKAALADIKARSGSDQVDLLIADLSSQADIKKLAERVLAHYPTLDVLINNAGVVTLERELSVDGIESTLAINYLGPYLLSALLAPRLSANRPARIVNVSSAIHTWGEIDFDDLGFEKRSFKFMRAYAQSKLLMNIATFEMARRMVGTGVTVNCLHPGGVNTHLGTDSARRFYMQWIDKFIKFFMISPEKAADTLVYLAISPAVESVTGQYFVKNKAVLASAACYDPELARRVWDVTNKLVDLKPPA